MGAPAGNEGVDSRLSLRGGLDFRGWEWGAKEMSERASSTYDVTEPRSCRPAPNIFRLSGLSVKKMCAPVDQPVVTQMNMDDATGFGGLGAVLDRGRIV